MTIDKDMKILAIGSIIVGLLLVFVAIDNTTSNEGSLNLNNLGIQYAYGQFFHCEDGGLILNVDDCPENQSLGDKIRNFIIALIFELFGDQIIDYFNPIT